MNSKLRIVLLVFFSALFIVSAVMLINQGLDYQSSKNDYEEADSIVGWPDDFDQMIQDFLNSKETEPNHGTDVTEPPSTGSNTASGETTDAGTRPPIDIGNNTYEGDPYVAVLTDVLKLKDLQKRNKDVIGYIYIKDTDIKYPLLHYTDNDRYLRSKWYDASIYSTAGTIFMDCKNSPDYSDFNTIVYGHRMRNETMFGKLKYYKSKSYWQEHQSVYIRTDEGVSRYDIYAAYEIATDGMTYQISFSDDAAKQAYIDFTLESSVINTGIRPTVNDQILTLSTCSGNGYETRWIVQAVRVF